jgi:hypothetical protein
MKNNPWNKIDFVIYEAHMSLPEIQQLQALDNEMQDQFSRYKVKTAAVLGVAGGNGLRHIDQEKYTYVFGIDINSDYLEICHERYPSLSGLFLPIHADLTRDFDKLPEIELIIANLFIEYIGLENFQKVIEKMSPSVVSCILQISEKGLVSSSPYVKAFESLSEIYEDISSDELTKTMSEVGYKGCFSTANQLPNGKTFVRLDFVQNS